MNRPLILVLLVFILFNGCFLSTPEDIPQANEVFFLSDRAGNTTTSFATGEDFYMYFNLVNTS